MIKEAILQGVEKLILDTFVEKLEKFDFIISDNSDAYWDYRCWEFRRYNLNSDEIYTTTTSLMVLVENGRLTLIDQNNPCGDGYNASVSVDLADPDCFDQLLSALLDYLNKMNLYKLKNNKCDCLYEEYRSWGNK